MQRIVFATSNENKMKEIREIMADLPVEILSMKEAGIKVDIVEDGSSFEENAIIKAETIAKITGDIVLADDSGLEIDYLNGEPGIYSARYMGEDTSYHLKNKNLVDRLEGVPDEKRTARFVCAIAAAFPDEETVAVQGTIEGRIGYEEQGENGFGYDPIFFVPEYGCTTAELTSEQKNAVSHRGKALRIIKRVLARYMNRHEEMPVYTNHNGGMRAVIISDSHGNDRNVDMLMEELGHIDLMIHLGDFEGSENRYKTKYTCPIEMVCGNNDFMTDLPMEKVIQLGNHRVFLTHGHKQYVYYDYDSLIQAAKERGCDYAFFGHIHKPVFESMDGITLLNPGSISWPRQQNRRPSYAIAEIGSDGEIDLEISYF